MRFVPREPGKHQYLLNRPATPVALGPDIVRFMRESQLEREAMRATKVVGDDGPRRPKSSRRAKEKTG